MNRNINLSKKGGNCRPEFAKTKIGTSFPTRWTKYCPTSRKAPSQILLLAGFSGKTHPVILYLPWKSSIFTNPSSNKKSPTTLMRVLSLWSTNSTTPGAKFIHNNNNDTTIKSVECSFTTLYRKILSSTF